MWYAGGMEIGGRWFSSELLERIQAAVQDEPALSRGALSRRVCEWLSWRAPNGRWQELSCRKALAALEKRGALALPKSEVQYAFQGPSQKPKEPAPDLPEVEGSLADLGRVEIIPVPSRYSQLSGIWNGLMSRYHYLGSGPLCGAQMRYLARSERYGWLGGLSFSGATWRLKERDKWIGWGEAGRRAHLREVVCNSRFLILPTVQVPNLASRMLSLALGRLRTDWRARYGYEPVLVETFVDPGRFEGTSYRAANWIRLGQTAARARPHRNGKVSEGKKDIYVVALDSRWKKKLCAVPERPLGRTPAPERPGHWAEVEFGRAEVYDARLKARLFRLALDFYDKPTASIPQACDGSVARTKAAYRFLANREVNMKRLLTSHTEATIERMREHRVVLAVQDTTALNYTAHPSTEDLGPMGTTAEGPQGLWVHDTMAFTTDGTPLGLLDVQCWARDPEDVGKKHRRHEVSVAEKESVKWLKSFRAAAEAQRLCPETNVVSVGDREADLYELFAEAQAAPGGPKLLVRGERTRQRQTEPTCDSWGDPHRLLWERMQAERVAGHQELCIPRRGSRPGRKAKLSVRHAAVTLQPPRHKRHLPGVKVWAVYACEGEYGSEVKDPVEWMLLTTVETNTFAQACERLAWYARRWNIEVYHRTLKSGCRIEDRRLNTAARLEACLAIDMVVAWRIYQLNRQARETPDLPCTVLLTDDEWRALYAYVNKQRPPEDPPTIRQAVRWIASLGGFLGRKSDGEPGTTTLWRGLERLADITSAYILFQSLHPARGP